MTIRWVSNDTAPQPVRRVYLDGREELIQFRTFTERADYLWRRGVLTASDRDAMAAQDQA